MEILSVINCGYAEGGTDPKTCFEASILLGSRGPCCHWLSLWFMLVSTQFITGQPNSKNILKVGAIID